MKFTHTIGVDEEWDDCLFHIWQVLRRGNPTTFPDISERNLRSLQHHIYMMQERGEISAVDLSDIAESFEDISTCKGYYTTEGWHDILLHLETYNSGQYEQLLYGPEGLLIKVHSPLYPFFKTKPLPTLVGMQLRAF